jgi:hypothetical protein
MTNVETLLSTSGAQRSILRLRSPSTRARLPKLRLRWGNRLREAAGYDVVDGVELHADACTLETLDGKRAGRELCAIPTYQREAQRVCARLLRRGTCVRCARETRYTRWRVDPQRFDAYGLGVPSIQVGLMCTV